MIATTTPARSRRKLSPTFVGALQIDCDMWLILALAGALALLTWFGYSGARYAAAAPVSARRELGIA